MKLIKYAMPAILALSGPLLSAAEGDKAWSHSLSLGYNRTNGNTDTELFSTDYAGEKKKEKSKTKVGANAQIGRDKGAQTANNYGLFGQYNYNFTDKYYWYVKGAYDSDKIADLDRRVTVGPGLGRYLVESEKTTLDFELGLTYISEKFKGVSGEDDLGYRAAQNFSYKFNDTASLWQNAEYVGNSDDSNDYILKAQLGVKSSMTSMLSLKAYIENEHNSQPALGKTKNDTSFVTMLVISF